VYQVPSPLGSRQPALLWDISCGTSDIVALAERPHYTVWQNVIAGHLLLPGAVAARIAFARAHRDLLSGVYIDILIAEVTHNRVASALQG